MEHDSSANQWQSLQTQRQGADGAHSLPNPQEQAKAASREALEAKQEAQEAIKRAYVKQMAAQEKAARASEQVVSDQELARRVTVQAATQAAEKATAEQKERASKELRDTSIAQEAAQSALASFPAGNQLGVSIPSSQSGFIPYSSAVHSASVQPQGQQRNSLQSTLRGAVQKGQSQPMNQSSNTMRSPQRCQEMLLQGANQMAQSATAQMAAAQNLAAGASDPFNQHAAREQAEAAQKQMMMAHQIAAAAQAPDTAVQAAAYLPNLFNKA